MMAKKILILAGSPKRGGNTDTLVGWFAEGARSSGAEVEIVNTAFLKYKSTGCISCRVCQNREAYECVIDDEAKPVLSKMISADVIVMATPLYFWAASAQLKMIIDRMFSLYKFDNTTNTSKTPLKGKTIVLVASSYDPEGLDILEGPFKAIAEYTGMKYRSLLVPDAGVSGDLKGRDDVRKKAFSLGQVV